MPAQFPGGATNTYVPSTEATNNMVVDFSRNPTKFALNKYIQIVPVTKDVGYYTEMTVEEAGRIMHTDLRGHNWADGEDQPSDKGQTESFEFKAYQTKRRVFGFRIGEKAAKQASWDILAQHGRIKAQQAMTGRTQIVTTLLTTAANWPTDNTKAVSTISGVTGKWDVSTTARKDIKRSIDFGIDQIRKATLGGVSLDEIKLVMSPGCARKISVSQEIIDYIKGSPDAQKELEGKLGPNTQYGLPTYLYGVELCIEDAVKVTNRKGAAKVTSYVWGDTTPALISRPGALVATEDSNTAPRFSTVALFSFSDMVVESKHDTDNKVHKGRIIDDFDVRVTAGISGFLFTAAVD